MHFRTLDLGKDTFFIGFLPISLLTERYHLVTTFGIKNETGRKPVSLHG
jgi:hypothetical protein